MSARRSVLLGVALLAVVLCAFLARVSLRTDRRVPPRSDVETYGQRASASEAPPSALASPPGEQDAAPTSPEGAEHTSAEIADAELVATPEFPPPRLYIRGAVVDPAGEYAPHCSIGVRDASWEWVHASSNSQGAFEIGPLSAGEYSLEASPSGRNEQPFVTDSLPVDVRAGEQDVVLQLRSAGVLRGVVRDPATGVLERCELRLFPEASVREVGSLVSSEGNAEFRFTQLPVGNYQLVAWELDGDRVAVQADVEVAAGHETEVELVLEPGTTVTFALADGVEADVVVRAWTGERSLGVDWVTHRDPLEVRAPLGELRYVVESWHPTRWTGGEQRLTLAEGDRPRIEIRR